MALAMMVTTRLWRGGEVSARRDLPLIRRLIERGRRWAAYRPLLVGTDGVVSSLRAMRETLRDPVTRGRADGPGCVPGAMSSLPRSSSAPSGGGWSRPNAAFSMARRHAWRRSDAGRKETA